MSFRAVDAVSARRVSRGLPTSLAAHDLVVFAYLVVLFALVMAGAGADRSTALALVAGDVAWFAFALTIVRLPEKHGRWAEGFYRLSLVGIVLASYMQLRWILPVVSGRMVDAELLALDLRVFGVEPAFAWDRFVTPLTTEWFSFFYFSYFFLLAGFVFPITLLTKNVEALTEFAFGIILLYCASHLGYVVVPALGPHVQEHLFTHHFAGNLWWPLVRDTVDAAGARSDVFPSLHTAAPTFLALYALRHRGAPIYRWIWLPTTFVALQIVLATMFLRWHYLVDVLVGLALAGAVSALAPMVARWDIARRTRNGQPPVFSRL